MSLADCLLCIVIVIKALSVRTIERETNHVECLSQGIDAKIVFQRQNLHPPPPFFPPSRPARLAVKQRSFLPCTRQRNANVVSCVNLHSAQSHVLCPGLFIVIRWEFPEGKLFPGWLMSASGAGNEFLPVGEKSEV